MVNPLNIPLGLCRCGCGESTRISDKTDRSRGSVKGQPVAFKRGHHLRLPEFKGRGSPRYQGGKSIDSRGYVTVGLPDGTRDYEHILVAEGVLGRKLKSFGRGHPNSEVVHHVHGDKSRNTNDNLLICTHEYHTALHHRLEQSPDWPEFPPVVRRGFGGQK